MARILIGNIKGPVGPTGPQGKQGIQGPVGPQGPLPPLINNALATQAGVAALDAVMGKTLKDELDQVNADFAAKDISGSSLSTITRSGWYTGMNIPEITVYGLPNAWYRIFANVQADNSKMFSFASNEGKMYMGWIDAGQSTFRLVKELPSKDDFVVKTYNAFQGGVTGYLYFEKNNITKICHCSGFLGTVPSGTTYVLQVDSSLFPSAQITRQAIKNDVSTIINGIIDFRTDGGLRIRSLDASTSGNYMVDFSFKTN